MQDAPINTMLKSLSSQGLRMLGINQIVYIKAAVGAGNRPVWALHAADGTLLSVQDNADQAFILAQTNDLSPVTVH
jgi:hypothetical protein